MPIYFLSLPLPIATPSTSSFKFIHSFHCNCYSLHIGLRTHPRYGGVWFWRCLVLAVFMLEEGRPLRSLRPKNGSRSNPGFRTLGRQHLSPSFSAGHVERLQNSRQIRRSTADKNRISYITLSLFDSLNARSNATHHA